MAAEKLSNGDVNDVLGIIRKCTSRVLDGRSEDILADLTTSFGADGAAFLSADEYQAGINLNRSYTVYTDSEYLSKYSDFFWKQDPLYKMQFGPHSQRNVFKTDDVIPYSKLINLEYYQAFLRPQNLMGELIIRLDPDEDVINSISLQRAKTRSSFQDKDLQKASLIAPFLAEIFKAARKFTRINDERTLLEQWLESRTEGVMLLDANYQLLFDNSKARRFYEVVREEHGSSRESGCSSVPDIILQDCSNLRKLWDQHASLQGASNRIISTSNNNRYYLQYFPIDSVIKGKQLSRFIIFLNELHTDEQQTGEVPTKQEKLTQREDAILQFVAEGLSNKQIAEKLYISPYTVQNHLKNIFRKTGISNRTRLANFFKCIDQPFSTQH